MIAVRGVPWMLLGKRAMAVAAVAFSGLMRTMNIMNSIETKNILYLSRYK
jgi:hypothetical protein